MKKKKQVTKEAMITLGACVTYLMVTFSYHHIDKYLTGPVFIFLTILIPLAFIVMLFYAFTGIIFILGYRARLSSSSLLPTITVLLTFIYLFSPWQIDCNDFESRVEMRACYEGTQNQAYILFRQNRTFELNWTGVFGYDEWWTGQWTKRGDSLFLKYDKGKVKQLGDTLLIANGYLNPIGHSVDKVKFRRPKFYLGYCKHEN